MKIDIKSVAPHLIAILIFIITSCVYFLPQLQGKALRQSDIQQYQGMASEIVKYDKKGENILWTNSMFSGMPAFQISGPQKNNLSKYIESLSQLFFKRPIGYFIGGMIAFYISLLLLGVDKWLAVLGAITFAFTTNNLVLYEAGHTSKVRVLMMSILIIAGIIKIFRKEYLVGGLAFAAGFAVSLYANHFQMTYYIGMLMALYVLIGSVDFILRSDFSGLGKAIGISAIAGLLAIGASASKIWTTYEYGNSTMRGKPILEKVENQPKASSSSETNGLDWTYAMNWSNGLIDVIGVYIPGVAGGGASEPISRSSATNKYRKKNRLQSLKYGPLYWGKLPFTSGPAYIGAVSIFLFILSLFVLRGRMQIWAIAAVLLTLFMSMGKNMAWFNQFLFDYLPLYNKFRSPSSVTSITAIIVPLVAMLGLNEIFSAKKDKLKADSKLVRNLFVATGVLSLISLFFILLGPSIFSFEAAGDQRYAQQPGLIEAFRADRLSLMRSDAIRTLLLTLASASVVYFFIKGRIGKILAFSLLAILVLFDLWGVDKRYINNDSFVKVRSIRSSLAPRTVDKQILADTDIHYRVHDITTPYDGPFNSTTASLHHKAIGGYHAAKLQRYTDIIEKYLMQGNQQVFNMLNMKYLITGSPGKEEIRKNPGALGNSWFVSEVKSVSSNRAELNEIQGINPKETAIVHDEFTAKLPITYSQGNISLSTYNPDELTYKSNNSSEGLAVFSEVWYGPNMGWKAYIDGEESEIMRANYILRALKIPAGQHEIVFKFHPKSYYTGEIISLICSILLYLGIGYALWLTLKVNKADSKEKV